MSTTTVVQHQPWCRDHYTEHDHPEQAGWCHHTFLAERGRGRVPPHVRQHPAPDARQR